MVNLITEHIDIWTTAQTQKINSGRGRGKNSNGQSPHGIKKVRELILELAVRGKLVPQNLNDEPASILLEKIAKEKARLIKEGKIKKQKKLPEISENEKPFELPTGWVWVRNGALFSLRKGKKPKNLTEQAIGLPYLDIAALDRDEITRYTDDEKCPQATDEDILVVCDGSRSGLLLNGKNGVVGSTLAVIDSPSIIKPYLKVLFAKAYQHLNSTMKGAAIPHLDTKKLLAAVTTLPPKAEQICIVAKVDELMALCDQLEQQQTDSNETHQTLVETLLATLINSADQGEFAKAWQRIANYFDTLLTTEQSIDQLKQTILQLAIMGKLVPQDPNDKPASVLLKKIAEEKAQLIKEGKIKKQKLSPGISEDEKPFDLPLGWALSRFSEVSKEVSTGPFGSMIHKRDYIEGGIPLINPSHMVDCSISEEKSVAVSQNKAKELLSYKLEEGDIVMARRGEMGRCALVTEREDGWLCGTGSFRLKFHVDIYREYILLLFKTERVRKYLGGKSVGMTMTNLNHGILKMMPVPLPPVAEQKRIVAKVDGLMALCDTLKARLNDAQTTQVQLADTIVEQAVA